ncbi:MAG TPA: hypothetical protein VF472_24755 [Burkholderiaceae bacterium]
MMSGSIAADAERALREARASLVQASDLLERAGFGSLTIGLLEDAIVAVDSAMDNTFDAALAQR